MTIPRILHQPTQAITALCLFLVSFSSGQALSENGWVLPTHGKIRILAVFVELDYGDDRESDLFPDGTKEWPIGELPRFKDELFNVTEREKELRTMTDYYDQISFGNFVLLGDYFPEVITLDHKEIGRSRTKILSAVAERLSEAEVISNRGLRVEDFDLWKNSTGNGQPKERSDSFEGVDHLMIMLRNFKPIPNGMGQASGSSGGRVKGKNTDSYSIFGAGDGLPFKMFRHEFNHLLIGGNNFHAGGGNAVAFKSYHFFVQAGWSMMGAANASFLTCSAWDRYWLGWKPKEKNGLIQALNERGEPVNGDLNHENGAGIYILRDFLMTGDVLRIALPHIPEGEFPQWIWVENHTTKAFNGSEFDVFQYEHADCIANSKPGLYLMRQIDANQKEGKSIYSQVNADYLKPLPAEGCFDFVWDEEPTSLPRCISPHDNRAYELIPDMENPLTGNHTLEFPIEYKQGDVKADVTKTPVPGLRRAPDGFIRLPYLGHPGNGFREGEKDMLGIGTNPSTASVLTNLNRKKRRSDDEQNSDAIYLNGISMKILETFPDGSIKVEVSFNDSLISGKRRWCAPEVILSNHNDTGADLVVTGELELDRGHTLTRYLEPDTLNGMTYFSSLTQLRVKNGATLRVEGDLVLSKDSRLVIEGGGELILNRGAKLRLNDQSELVVESGGSIGGRGRIKPRDQSAIIPEDKSMESQLRKRTCKKRYISIKP